MNPHRLLRLAVLSSLSVVSPAFAAADYQLGSDSLPQDGVPQGEVTKYHWSSKIFPGTERDYWVYVPKQYDMTKPACVMVFQDGGGYVNTNTNGKWRVPSVIDTLVATKEMLVTV